MKTQDSCFICCDEALDLTTATVFSDEDAFISLLEVVATEYLEDDRIGFLQTFTSMPELITGTVAREMVNISTWLRRIKFLWGLICLEDFSFSASIFTYIGKHIQTLQHTYTQTEHLDKQLVLRMHLCYRDADMNVAHLNKLKKPSISHPSLHDLSQHSGLE